jgi:SnoaL-like domain
MQPGLRHAVFNVHVEGDGDAAEGRAYVAAYSVAGPATLVTTGRYRDELERVHGTWRFARRCFTPDPGPPAPE